MKSVTCYSVSVSVSGWTLVAISVERFYAICHPLTSRKWQTRNHARRIILAVWMLSLCIMSPVAFLSELRPVIGNDGRRKCREVWPDETLEKSFTVLLDVVLLVVPLLIMVAMYGLIVNHLWNGDEDSNSPQGAVGLEEGARTSIPSLSTINDPNHTASLNILANKTYPLNEPNRGSLTGFDRNAPVQTSLLTKKGSNSSAGHGTLVLSASRIRRCNNTENSCNTKRRVLKMLIVVVLEFFICWTPLYVVNTLSFFAPQALYEGLGYTGISMLQLLAQASCCCNPITYCFMSSSFRSAFLKAFGCDKA